MNEVLMAWMDEGSTRLGDAKREMLKQVAAERCKMERLMKAHHIHKACLISAGVGVAALLVGSACKRRMYRCAVAKEVKKQLDPVNRKLDELKAQNEALKQQNQVLLDRLQTPEAPAEQPPEA